MLCPARPTTALLVLSLPLVLVMLMLLTLLLALVLAPPLTLLLPLTMTSLTLPLALSLTLVMTLRTVLGMFFGSMPATRLLVCRTLATTLRSEEHTSELQSRGHLVCRLLLEKKKTDGSDD